MRGGGIFDAGMAVSHFQDAVELALVSTAAQFGVDLKDRAGFLDIWDAASSAARDAGMEKIPLRTDMKAMNAARIGFKHMGNRVERSDAEVHYVNVERVLSFICSQYFDLNFDKLSLVTYVTVEIERQALQEALDCLDAKDKIGALRKCIDALKLMDERSSWFYEPGHLVQFSNMDREVFDYIRSQIGHLRGYVRHVERLVMAGFYGVPPMELSVVDLMLAKMSDAASAELLARAVSDDIISRGIEILTLNSIGISDRQSEVRGLIPGTNG